MASNDNPSVWQEAQSGTSYAPPQSQGSDLTNTLLLNAAEQAVAFTEAHLNQCKQLIAQYRSVNGL